MARFYGKVGYSIGQVETSPGIYNDQIKEHIYSGDVTRNNRRMEGSDSVNMNIISSNTISIIADDYAFGHFFDIKYVWWMGCRWVVTQVEVQRPRLILTLGGVYNGVEATTE